MQCAHPAGEALAQGKRVTLRIDLLPEAPAATWRAWMAERAGQGIRTDTLFTGLLHPRIAHWLLQLAHITPGDPVTGPALDTLAALVRDLPLRITGVEGFDRAQVTAGGADASAFDPATLQSRIHPGLFIAGELLDVDGDCGGYNLMWAWLSGRAAGRAAALGT
jgi:predicted flavoprotein YhiN